MASHHILILLIATLLTITTLSSAQTACTSDEECNVSSATRLICSNGTCTCPSNTYTMTRLFQKSIKCIPKMLDTQKSCTESSDCDPISERCLPKNNGTCFRCSYGRFSSSSDDNYECEGPTVDEKCSEREISPHVLACRGEGLECDYYESQTCLCQDGFFYNTDSERCEPFPKLGEDCTLSKQCKDERDGYGFTKCSKNNTCLCVGITNRKGTYCYQLPTKLCKSHNHCPPNARCIGSECDCSDNTVDSRQGECMSYHFESRCSTGDLETELNQKELNHQGLKCINAQYHCSAPDQQFYETGPVGKWQWWRKWRHICVIEVGGTCTGDDDWRCVDGASCVEARGNFSCQCDPGHSRTPENKCFKHVEFGESCTNDCNHFSGQVCIDGTCQCPNPNIRYDPDMKKCLGSEGQFCGTLSLGAEVKIECQRGLKCGVPSGPVHQKPTCLLI